MAAQYKTFATMASVPEKQNSSGPIAPDVPHISSVHHRADVLKSNRVVVIYYHAEWCAPCKKFAPEFNELAQKWARSGVAFVKEYVDDEFDIPDDITAVQCFHFYYAGQFQPKMTLTGVDKFAIETNLNSMRE